jgi:hypothetical protein
LAGRRRSKEHMHWRNRVLLGKLHKHSAV